MRRHAKPSSAGSSSGIGASRAPFGVACLCVLGLAAFLGSGTSSAAAADACPNAEIRAAQNASNLPECRAYELVSPPDKEGNTVDPRATIQSAPDGNVVAYSVSNGFGGAEASLNGGYYIARRSGEGWSSEAIDAPQANRDLQVVRPSLYLSSDLSSTIQLGTSVLTPGGVKEGGNLYRRDNLTGTRRAARLRQRKDPGVRARAGDESAAPGSRRRPLAFRLHHQRTTAPRGGSGSAERL